MTSFLVLPDRHGLIPLAWRLRSEGHTVEVVPRSNRYERAWQGLFEPVLTGSDKFWSGQLEPVQEKAREGEFVVITDSPKWEEKFGDAKYLLGRGGFAEPTGAVVEFGGWVRRTAGAETQVLMHTHLLFRDVGAWPGGLGQRVTAGAVAQWGGLQKIEEKLTGALLAALDDEYQGLVRVGLDLSPEGVLEVGQISTGWDLFQAQLLLAQIPERFAELLQAHNVPALNGTYSAALAISVPPWPITDLPSKTVPITGLKSTKDISWFDVRLVDGQMQTAQLDGLVGIARYNAATPQLAISTVLELAQQIELPEKQFRHDVGSTYTMAVCELDRAGLL